MEAVGDLVDGAVAPGGDDEGGTGQGGELGGVSRALRGPQLNLEATRGEDLRAALEAILVPG